MINVSNAKKRKHRESIFSCLVLFSTLFFVNNFCSIKPKKKYEIKKDFRKLVSLSVCSHRFASNLALFRFLMRKKDKLKRCIWNWICHIFSVRERALCSPTASQDMIVEIFVDFASEFYYGLRGFFRIFGSFYFKYCTIFTWILSICISFNNKYFFSLSFAPRIKCVLRIYIIFNKIFLCFASLCGFGYWRLSFYLTFQCRKKGKFASSHHGHHIYMWIGNEREKPRKSSNSENIFYHGQCDEPNISSGQ